MISIYDSTNRNYSGNGTAVLCPTVAKIRMVAGGEYSFTMEHPIDPWGKWKHIVREAVVKLPVPMETIPAATVGYDTDVYITTENNAELREGPSEPSSIVYSAWVSGTSYAVGSKVTSTGSNYQLIAALTGLEIYADPGSSSKWKTIPNKTNGSPVLATLKEDTELFLVEDVDTTWYKMQTTYGLEGYIKKSQVEYDRHITPEDLEPRVITEQLFRIKEVQVDRKSGKVNVSGNHVSNDLNGVLVREVNLTNAVPAMAIGKITENFMMDYQGEIATNITDDSEGTYTATIKRKNGMYCITDPDAGVVPKFNAQLTRDNWDLFIMSQTADRPTYFIKYGKNVNGIVWKVNTTGLITRVVPVAKAENGDDLYLPELYIDSEYISNYPEIYMSPLEVKGQVGKDDGSETDTTWTEEALLDEMRTKASERFTVDKVDIPVTEVTVQLEQVGNSAEYAWMKGLDNITLYDVVNVEDEDIGLDINLKAQEIEYDCIREKVSGLKLSNNIYGKDRTVAGYNIINGALTENKLAGGVKDGIVSAAVDQVLSIIE